MTVALACPWPPASRDLTLSTARWRGGVLLDDLHRAGERHRHRAHLDLDLGLDGVGAGPLDHAAALDARHDALEVEDRGVAVVDRPRGRERMVQLYGHAHRPSSRWMDRAIRGTIGSARGDSGRHVRLGPGERHAVGADRSAPARRPRRGTTSLIHVTAWEATLDGRRGPAPPSLELDADAHVAARHRGHRRHAGARRRRQGEHRADDRRRGAEAAEHRVPLDRGAAGRRRRRAQRARAT